MVWNALEVSEFAKLILASSAIDEWRRLTDELRYGPDQAATIMVDTAFVIARHCASNWEEGERNTLHHQ